jgi:hypothetical protein
MYSNWYTLCALCQLAAGRVGVDDEQVSAQNM